MGKRVGARIGLRALALFVAAIAAISAAAPGSVVQLASAGSLRLQGYVAASPVALAGNAPRRHPEGGKAMTLAVVADSPAYDVIPTVVRPRTDSPDLRVERVAEDDWALVLVGDSLTDQNVRETIRVTICVK